LFVDDPMEFEEVVLSKLGLKVAEHSTQIVPPESLARILDEAVIVAGAISNLATDMRHLQRSEIAEIREKFDPSQTGSSTMAHKRNPISFENVNALFKEVLAQQFVVGQNLVSEHQRDLTDSASARFYPVLIAGLVQMAKKLDATMGKIEVDEDAMMRNLQMSKGAIGAEPLYLLLGKHGHTSGHEKSKAIAHAALDASITFSEAVKNDNEIMENYWTKFSESEQRIIIEPEKYYTGLAVKKTKLIIDNWKSKL